MKLNQNQINNHLLKNKKLTNTFYWINTEDSYLLHDCAKKIRRAATNNGFDEKLIFHIDTHSDWLEIKSSLLTPSLFSEKKILELHFTTKLTPSQRQSLIELAELSNSTPDSLLLILYPFRVEAKTLKQKWMEKLDKAGVVITIWPLSQTDYPRWLRSECQKYKINFAQDSDFHYLCQKTMCNPSAAAQTLFKLRLQDINQTSQQQLEIILSEHANYTVFDLTDSYLAGNLQSCFTILQTLKRIGTAPLLIIWSLGKELMQVADILEQAISQNKLPLQALNELKLWQNKKNILASALKKFNLATIYKSLNLIAQIEESIKTENDTTFVWQQLEQLLLLSANIELFPCTQAVTQ